jgi:hypothetical protein
VPEEKSSVMKLKLRRGTSTHHAWKTMMESCWSLLSSCTSEYMCGTVSGVHRLAWFHATSTPRLSSKPLYTHFIAPFPRTSSNYIYMHAKPSCKWQRERKSWTLLMCA